MDRRGLAQTHQAYAFPSCPLEDNLPFEFLFSDGPSSFTEPSDVIYRGAKEQMGHSSLTPPPLPTLSPPPRPPVEELLFFGKCDLHCISGNRSNLKDNTLFHFLKNKGGNSPLPKAGVYGCSLFVTNIGNGENLSSSAGPFR